MKEEFNLEPYGLCHTKRLTTPEAEEILYSPVKCLDHGFVRLIDYSGGDKSIVQAARVSYGAGTKKTSEDEGLIRYLMRHRHTTPFEMVELKFHAKMPIFVARQWVRHRTASLNEASLRYSVGDKEFYLPEKEVLSAQSKGNKQGRDEILNPAEAEKVLEILKLDAEKSYSNYQWMLNEDPQNPGKPNNPSRAMLARELARMNLSLNFYTQWYWKVNLHNLFHFLSLRKDSHAQYEIRVYADAMGEIASKVAPLAYKAFEDYNFNSMSLSALEISAVKRLTSGSSLEKVLEETFKNKRESQEFENKWKRILKDNQ